MDDLQASSWCELLQARRSSSLPWLIRPRDPLASSEHDLLTYAELWECALRFAAALAHEGVQPGDAVLVVSDNSVDNCVAVLGTLLHGASAVPVSPLGFGQETESWLRNLKLRHADSRASLLVTADAADLPRLAQVGIRAAQVSRLLASANARPAARPEALRGEAIAVIQYTSGTTDKPRGVELSNANILANVRAIGEAVGVGPQDKVACWLPLFHDMGLIGSLLFATYWGIPLVLSTPRSFVFRPESWLWSIARFGVTCSAAPNSAYDLCARRIADRKLQGLDLSRWRVAVNGGEQIHGATAERFWARFAPYGLAKSTLRAVYGLAENTVAVTFPEGELGVRIDTVDTQRLECDGMAVEAEDASSEVRAVVGVGRAIAGHALRIVDPESGQCREDRVVGEVQVRGPSTTRGYRGRSDPSLFDAGWLRTGDRGYTVAGELFLLGRSKHVIKHAGRAIDAAFLEGVVRARVPCLTAGVAVFGLASAQTGLEEVIVLAESPRAASEQEGALVAQIEQAIRAAVHLSPEVVRLVSPGSIPRTTSGKIQYGEARRRFLRRSLSLPVGAQTTSLHEARIVL